MKTPSCDAVAAKFSFKNQTHQQTADEATAFEDLARKLEDYIRSLNVKLEADCLQWTCGERDRGERCPNCPLDYYIKLP